MTSSDQPMDHVPPHAESNSGGAARGSDLEKHVKTRSTWIRLIFMIICSLLYALSRLVTFAVVVVQFLTVLLTGETNTQLKQWGRSLAVYSFEVVDFLTFNTEVKPFPFEAEWPSELPTANAPSEDDE
ncbi:MAG: DUF4389 domain-containing protein [Woeseiaceae bacterium]|jgi:hypothetical protein|nr:DUF4389 domain-containing protein [Woeseiaceae bacterium]|tara:strand:+ start:89 stop:472 length:384 start_codon:yes stop_codon:yes gene_type:complete